jgi:glutaredoxin
MIRALVFLLAVAAAANVAAQTIYRWTDAQGKVHYTSEPPANAKASAIRSRVNSYSAPANVEPVTGAPKAQVGAATPPVVMYATTWCPYCAKARDYFAQAGIAYVEHDVEKSASAHEEFKRLGGRGVPLIVVGREKMNGFSEQGFEHLMARAAP